MHRQAATTKSRSNSPNTNPTSNATPLPSPARRGFPASVCPRTCAPARNTGSLDPTTNPTSKKVYRSYSKPASLRIPLPYSQTLSSFRTQATADARSRSASPATRPRSQPGTRSGPPWPPSRVCARAGKPKVARPVGSVSVLLFSGSGLCSYVGRENRGASEYRPRAVR